MRRLTLMRFSLTRFSLMRFSLTQRALWQSGAACMIALAGLTGTPAAASTPTPAPGSHAGEVPSVLSDEEARYYRDVFAALDKEDWSRFEKLLDERRAGLLHQIAQAEFYTHARSPKISAQQIERWFKAGLHLPQAEQLGRMGQKRGLTYLPSLPSAQNFVRQPYASKRILPRSIDDGTMPHATRSAILERIKNDDPQGAQKLLEQVDSRLSASAKAEWRQRVAWSYYIENQDRPALELARTAAQGAGAWAAEGEWVAGLAAWRLNDCALAAQAFANAAQRSTNIELTSAAHFWASRSYLRCRRPGDADEQLRFAARSDETLYGMLANEQLGVTLPDGRASALFSRSDWERLRAEANVQIAAALIQIGRSSLADEVLRHQARIGRKDQYDSLSRFARALGMPSTQLWMAHNAPRGARSEPSMRYPVAHWQPSNGWRVDPALAFAHALQESNFRTSAVSPAQARGLMQITPITVRQHAPRLEMNARYVNLDDPQVNLAFGQQNLEMLRDSGATQGKLPKIMAAYNAGLSPISRWNSEIDDRGDPLLYMESIPYWETRGYVAIVMRNFWMYQRNSGAPSPSRKALAAGLWPGFPHFPQYRSAQRQIPARTRAIATTSRPVVQPIAGAETGSPDGSNPATPARGMPTSPAPIPSRAAQTPPSSSSPSEGAMGEEGRAPAGDASSEDASTGPGFSLRISAPRSDDEAGGGY